MWYFPEQHDVPAVVNSFSIVLPCNFNAYNSLLEWFSRCVRGVLLSIISFSSFKR